MPYKDRELRLLSRRLSRLRHAERLGKAYTPRTPEVTAHKQRKKFLWRLVQAIYRRMKTLRGETPGRQSSKRRQWKLWMVRHGEARKAKRRAAYEARCRAEGRTPRPVRPRSYGLPKREVRRRNKKNRQARKRGVSGSVSTGIRRCLFFLQKGRCAVCCVKLRRRGPQKFHLDHIEPLALGGPHTDANLQLLCPRCNVAKGARPPVEFMQAQGFLL